MNTKKVGSSFTSERVLNHSSAILFRLFVLWAFSCGFSFVAGRNNESSLSSADKSTFVYIVSSSGISSVIPSYSSQSVQVNLSSQNVNSTNTSSLTSLQNKTGILTILQSSNFPVVGSTEPITLALSFVTTTTSTQSVPRSVRSLLDASTFSIAGFTEPLSLALFTSDLLSNQSFESVSSSSTVVAPSNSVVSSLKETNVSTSSLHTVASSSQNVARVSSLSTGTTFSSSGNITSSSSGDPYTRTPSFVRYSSTTYASQGITVTESAGSSVQHISSEGSENLSKTQQATRDTYSSVQSNTSSAGTYPETSQAHSETSSKTVASLHSTEASSSSISHHASGSKVFLTTSPIVSVTNQLSNDVTTTTVLSSSETVFNNKSSFSASITKTLQVFSSVSIPLVTSGPLDTSKSPSESTSSHSRIALTTLNISSVVTPSPSGSFPNTSFKENVYNATLSSQAISMNYSNSQVVYWTTSSSANLESSTMQTTTTTDPIVNSSYVSLYRSADSTKTLESLSTSERSLLSKSSLLYSDYGLASTSSGLSTETLATSLNVPLETTSNYGSSLQGVNATSSSKQSTETSFVAGNTSSSLPVHSKDSTSIATQSIFTETRQITNVYITASTSSLPAKASIIQSPPSFTPGSKTSSVLLVLSSEHLDHTSVGFSLKSTSTSPMIASVSTLISPSATGSYFMQTLVATGKSTLLPNTTTVHYSSTTLNGTETSYLFSSNPTKYVDSTSQVPVTVSTSLSGSTSGVKQLTTSLSASNFPPTESQVLSSSYLLTDIPSSFLYTSSVTSPVTLSSLNASSIAANVSTDNSGPGISSDATSSLLHESGITQGITMSTPSSDVIRATVSTDQSGIGHSTDFTSLLFQSSSLRAESGSSRSVMGANVSTDLSVTRSVQVSRGATVSLSTSMRLLDFSSKPLDVSTPGITSSEDSGAITVSDRSLFSTSSSHVILYTTDDANKSSVILTTVLQNHTVSYPQFYSSNESGASTLQHKSLTLHSLTASITRTSFSAPELPSNVQPTSTLSAVTVTTSEYSTATLLVSSNASSHVTSTVTLSTVSMATSAAPSLDSFNGSSHIQPTLTLSAASMSSSKYSVTPSFDSSNGISNMQPTSTLSASTYSFVYPLVSSTLSMTASKSSFLSALDSYNASSTPFSSVTPATVTVATSVVSTYVSETFSFPRESTITVNSSIVTKPESSVSGFSISSGSDQMNSYSSSKSVKATLVTLGESASMSSNLSFTVHERSSYLHGESSFISTSGAGSFPQSEPVTPTLSSVNISSTPSFQPHPSTSDVPVVTTSSSLLSTPRFTGTVPTEDVSATPSSQIRPSSTVPVVTSSFAALSSSLRPTVLSVYASVTASLQAYSTPGVPVVTSRLVVLSSSLTQVVQSVNVSSTASPIATSSSGVYVVTSSFAALSTSLGSTVPSADVSSTASLPATSSRGVSVVTSSYVALSSSLTPAVPSANVSSTASPIATSSSGVSVVTSSYVALSSSLTPAVPSVHLLSTASLPASSSSGVSLVTSSYVTLSSLQRVSTPELVTTSSVISVPSGIFVRFGISVPRNQSLRDTNFIKALKEGILVAYQNGSSSALPGNISISIFSIERSLDSNSSNVNVTFKVLNGSEPLAAFSVIENIDRANFSLGQAVGYQVVYNLVIVYVSSSSSFPTMSMTSSISSSIQGINVTSITGRTLETHYFHSTQQPRASSTTDSPLTSVAESSLQSQRSTAAVSSVSFTAPFSSQIHPSSDVPVTIATHSMSVSSLQPTTSELAITSTVTIVPPSSVSTSFKTTRLTHFSRETLVTSALSSLQQSEVSSVTTHSQPTTSAEISQTGMFTVTVSSVNVPATPSSQIRPSSSVSLVTSSLVVLSSSLRSTVPSANVSATTSFQAHFSSGVSMVTSSLVMLSSSIRSTVRSAAVSATTSSQIRLSSGVSPVTSSLTVPSADMTATTSFETRLSSGVSMVTSSLVMLSSSLSSTVPSAHVPATTSFQARFSSGVSMVTSSLVLLSSSIRSTVRSADVSATTSSQIRLSSGVSPVTSSLTVPSANVSATTSFQTRLSSGVSTVTSSLVVLSSSLRSTVPSANASATTSFQLRVSSGVSMVTSSLVVLSSSLRSTVPYAHVSTTTSFQNRHSSGVSMVTSSLVALSSSLSSTVPSENVSATTSFQARFSSGVSMVTSSLVMLSSSLSSTVPSANASATTSFETRLSSGASPVTSSLVVLSFSLKSTVPSADVPATLSSQIRLSSGVSPVTSSLTVPSANVSATTSFQTGLSSGVSMATSSFVVLSSPLRPSSSELLSTSSVIAIPPGFFMRFGIGVPLNQSVNDVSFKNLLKKGILHAYENGSLDGISGNVSVNIISTVRSPNSTNVNVTFQVLNGSEPLLAYPVIQSIDRANITLAQAVGYEIIFKPIIVHLPSTSSLSTMLVTSATPSSFQPINVTRFSAKSFSSDVRQSSTVVTFSSSLAATVTDTFVVHATSSNVDSTTQRSFSPSASFNGSFTSLLTSASTFSRSLTSLTALPSSLESQSSSETLPLPSKSEVNQTSTAETMSMSTDTLTSSQTVLVSSSFLSLLQSTGATLRSQAASIVTSQPSLLHTLPTSYISVETVSLIAPSPSLKGSSAFVLVNSTETRSIFQTESSIALNSSTLTSSRSTAFTNITPKQRSSSEIISGSLSAIPDISSSIAPTTPMLSSVLLSVTSTASLVLSKSLSLNSSLFTQSVLVGNTSSVLTTISLLTSVLNSTVTLSRSQKSTNATTSLVSVSRSVIDTRTTVIIKTTFPSVTSGFAVSKTHVLTSAGDTMSSRLALLTSAFASTPVVSSSDSSLPVTVSQFSTITVSRSKTPILSPSGGNSTHLLSQSVETGSSQTTRSGPLFTPSVSSMESGIQRNSTIHMTSLNVVSRSSIPSSNGSDIHTSPTRTIFTRSAATFSVVDDTSSSMTSPVSRTRFSDVSTPKVSYTSSLTTSEMIELNITTSSVKISSLLAVDTSTQRGVLFSNMTTFVHTAVTPMTTRTVATSLTSSQYHTTGFTVVATEKSFSSRPVQPSTSSMMKLASDTIFLVPSVTSVKNVSRRTALLSSLKTSTYSFQSFSSALFSHIGLSTTQSLNATHLSTPDVSGPPLTLTSSTSPKDTTVTSFYMSKSVTYFSSATVMKPRVSLTSSVTRGSVGSIVTPVASPSVVTPGAKLSTSFSSTKSESDTTSRTASRHISLSTSKVLSQTTRTVIKLSPSSLLVATASVKSSVVDSVASRSLISALTSKSSHIVTHSPSSALLVSSVAITDSSAKVISTTPLSIKSVSIRTSSAKSTVFAKTSTPVLISSSSRTAMLRSSSVIVTKSSLLTLLLPSSTMVIKESSLLLGISSEYFISRTSKKSPSTSVKPPVTSLGVSSSLVYTSSSSFSFSSAKPAITTTTATALVYTSGTPSRTTITSIIVVRETSETISISKTVPLSSVKPSLSTTKNVTTTPTPEKSSSSSRSSSTAIPSVGPTEPVRPTANANNTEGLVGIQILVPMTEDENNSSFRETIESRLAAAYRWGQEKENKRNKRDLGWIDENLWGTVNWNTRNFESWKRSPAFKVYEKRGRRFRRQVDNIVALAETIRRAKPIVGEEIVDIEYRMFDGLAMLSAEHVVETMNRLSEAELVSTIKYGVTLRPYVVKEIQVTPVPRASKWETLIPAIIVPIVVVLFLILAFTWAKCAAKRKRERQKVKPRKQPHYENLEVKVLPSHNVIPPPHGLTKKKRPSSISSMSSSDIPSKLPTLPVPDYSPGPSQIPAKPTQRYRRRTDDKRNDYKYNTSSTKDIAIVNGHITHERAVKKPKDTKDHIEMENLAGVVENRPQMRDEKLANSLKREEPPLRFTSLPPLIETPLVGPKPSNPQTVTQGKKEHERIIAESGVPPAWLDKMKMIALQNVAAAKEAELSEDEDTLNLKVNVERWRNKMRHREKLRQDMREKEREKEKKLKKYEREEKKEKDNETTEDYDSTSQRSLTAERKRRSRLDRWRKNRVGTSSSKSSSSSSSSSDSDSDQNKKRKKEEEKNKKKKRQAKEKKKKEKVPHLATGQAAKATAQEALRETAWTIKETPGVRLVSVRPRNEVQQGWQEPTTEPAYLQNGMQVHNVPPSRPVSSRSQQRDRVHYLLETGYPVLPVMPTPLVQPPPTEYLVNDDQPYEDMEGLDPYTVQYYDDGYKTVHEGVPTEPRQAFGGPSIYGDEHIYEEPYMTPASLPETRFVSPRENQSRVLVPTQYAHGYVGRSPMARGRPTSASRHPGVARQAISSRPTSAKTEPVARYVAPPGRSSPHNQSIALPPVPGSRYMITNRPTVATAPQPSIGTSPRYMVDPELQREQPSSSFDGARVILSRAQANVDRFEQDGRVNALDETDAASRSEHLYARPQKTTPPHAHAARKEPASSSSGSRLDVAAKEHAELEAQLLVSRALARARSNVRT